MNGEIVTPYIKSEDQIGELFTKAVHKSSFHHLCSKLGIKNNDEISFEKVKQIQKRKKQEIQGQ